MECIALWNKVYYTCAGYAYRWPYSMSSMLLCYFKHIPKPGSTFYNCQICVIWTCNTISSMSTITSSINTQEVWMWTLTSAWIYEQMDVSVCCLTRKITSPQGQSCSDLCWFGFYRWLFNAELMVHMDWTRNQLCWLNARFWRTLENITFQNDCQDEIEREIIQV